MSTLTISKNHFETIAYNAKMYQYKKVINKNYCNTLAMFDNKIENWITELYILNQKEFGLHPFEILDFKKEKKVLNCFEMLKLLECISYNITASDNWAYITLKKAIEEIKSNIISEIEEYKNANWAI